MSDPSPSNDDVAHAVLVAAGEKMLVGDSSGQNIPGITLRFLVWKVDSLVRSLSVHPLAFRAVQ